MSLPTTPHRRARLERLEARQLFAGGMDWSTFLGGSGSDTISDVAAVPDASGDVVVTGTTSSEDFPATGGTRPPADPNGSASPSAFVARLSGDGKRLVYATYFGGAGAAPRNLAVGADGSPVVVGQASGDDFPATPGAFATTPSPDGDEIFAARFDPSGRLVFASAFGGSSGATVTGVGLDGTGGVVLSGYTDSPDFPTTAGAYDRTINQRVVDGEPEVTTDAFVSRLGPDGAQLTYSTFIGGEGDDAANAVTVDRNGFVTLVGETSAAEETAGPNDTTVFVGRPFPTTADGFQRTFQEQEDAFVARLKLDGGGAADLKYGSILGSFGEDIAWGVAHDSGDPLKVVVTTQTDGWNFPTTPGALQRTRVHPDLEGDPDLGVTAFRFGQISGGRLEWSTLHGQIAAYISEVDVAIDSTGGVVLAGTQERYTFGGQNDRPVTPGAFDATPGENPAFISRLSADGRQLLYATNLDFIGPSVQRLAVVGPDSVVIAGTTNRSEWATTAGSLDPVLNDGTFQVNPGNDGYVARFTLTPLDPNDAAGPAAPALAALADEAQLQQETPEGAGAMVTFDWADVTDPSGVRLYELEIGHNAEFVQNNETDDGARTLVRAEESEVQVGMTELRDGAVYHWRVRALDGAHNFGPWSEARTFVLGEAGEPRLAAATVTPDGVRGGTAAQAKVLLQGVAPAGGTVITLVTSDRNLLQAPATVTVPAGASSVTFPVTTRAVTRSTPVWVEMKLGEDTSAPVLWLDPGGATRPPPTPNPTRVRLKSLSVSPGALVGGTKATGTVRLDRAAPAGGLFVKLASTNRLAAAVPSGVRVAAGKTTATFEIVTRAVASPVSLQIYGTAGGGTESARLTVNPAPRRDTVAVRKAEYRPSRRELRIEATSTNRSAVLKVYNTATGRLIGTLTREGDGRYRGRFTVSPRPARISVRSSLGGSASINVVLK